MLTYSFWGFPAFIKAFSNARIINLMGNMGTGKTLFATALGYRLLMDTFVLRVATNYPCSFSQAPKPNNCYAVLDEGALVFDSRISYKDKNLSAILAQLTFDLRKSGSYLAVPSFIDVDKRLRTGVRVWRVWALSNYIWSYFWELGEEDTASRRVGVNYWSGSLWFINPSFFFNTYDTYFVPGKKLSESFIKGFMRDEYKKSVSVA